MVSSWTFLSVSLVVRLLSSSINIIDDCDEVYNYWEPLALFVFGSGFQTWEYSGDYGLRSYWYPGLLSLLVYPLRSLSRVTLFFIYRAFLGLLCSVCETFFFASAVSRWGNKDKTGVFNSVLALGLLTTPGMFAASTSLLPNSLSMCLYMVAFGFWINENYVGALVASVASAALGVPFSAVLAAFLVLHCMFRLGFFKTVALGCVSVALFIGPQLLVDYYFYGRWVFAVFNIVFYNALSGETDSTLYGVEPWTYYVKNLLLNMNLIFPAALLLFRNVIPWKRTTSWTDFFIPASGFIWLGVMMILPHKEQRFLYPIYPLLALAAAFGLLIVARLFSSRSIIKVLLTAFIVLSLSLSASRIAAQSVYRDAPMKTWHHFSGVRNATICLGDEWYRFPSTFWLPNDAVKVEFIRSGFKGLLPRHYAPWPDATRVPPPHMNDKNKEEEERYVPLSSCDYLVIEGPAPPEIKARATTLSSLPIIDDSATSTLFRAFYIPFIGPSKATFKRYNAFAIKRS